MTQPFQLLWRLQTIRFVDRRPDPIEFWERTVGVRLAPIAAPDPLLRVQGGLVPRKIIEPEAQEGDEEGVDFRTIVSPSAIDVEPDRVAPEPRAHMAGCLREARPIAPRHLHHTTPAEEGRYLSAETEACVALARRGNPEALTALPPRMPEARMQANTDVVDGKSKLARRSP